MNKKTINLIGLAMLAGTLIFTTSCKKEKDSVSPGSQDTITADNRPFYHVAFAVDPEGNPSETYFQQISDLKGASVSFEGLGYKLHSTRTARPYSSPNGRFIYSYDYLGGQVYSYKAEAGGASSYSLVDQINATPSIGSNAARFTKVNDDNCMLHIVTSNTTATGIERDGNGDFVRRKNMGAFIRIATNTADGSLTMGAPAQFEIMLDAAEAKSGVYISRIDAPAVANGKIYYGYARSKVTPGTLAADNSYSPSDANVLVMDYPSLTNPKVIRTAKAEGNTNGYRTPMAHANENGEVYQMVSASGKDTKILKLKDGAFDESYEFNLSQLLGKKTASNGWFYVGNGIAYVPFYDTDLGAASTANWFVARVDLKSNTAVVLNLPQGLWLQQYQYSVMSKGKFVMAINPKDSDGNIYFLDPASTSADGFEKGAALKGATGTAYIGVF